jgi:23S rRNA pseudouridine1911/1915/1917 synthase
MGPGDAGQHPLLDRLRAQFPESSGRTIRAWLATGRIRVEGRVARDGREPVHPATRVELGPPPPPVLPPPLRLVHEDSDLLVIDKPVGLLTIATERERERTAYRLVWDYLAAQRPPRRPFVVHRLDRETSGLLVVAKAVAAKRALQAQFAARRVDRHYEAVVEGLVRDDGGTLDSVLVETRNLRVRATGHRPGGPSRPQPLAGQRAITHFRVLERRGDTTRLALDLGTGRRQQIRVQLAEWGHPIVGDRAHGSRRDPLRRLCLHATRLGFVHPTTGRRLQFESPAPAAFARIGASTPQSRPPASGRPPRRR